eukprot:CAMPEP_0204198828 /NCGR_PEP_ID=MMETSP0361-20130328/65571_1 /ASSEMBLY_ACC=CAM_ASM_000343 /TAXON_ID=268821 /ORGANISM="Scrippsiella Hangoei, Strain SHTV-5" /LENGTH=67 /DNA_ID=CAMNT_0051161019 /DNA_START=1 /DNA_END=202 /DNA_ORIENTATION=+
MPFETVEGNIITSELHWRFRTASAPHSGKQVEERGVEQGALGDFVPCFDKHKVTLAFENHVTSPPLQ